jgi:hypothetical protein
MLFPTQRRFVPGLKIDIPSAVEGNAPERGRRGELGDPAPSRTAVRGQERFAEMTSRDRKLIAASLVPAAAYVLVLLAVFFIRPDLLRFGPLWLMLTVVVTVIPPACAHFVRLRSNQTRNLG